MKNSHILFFFKFFLQRHFYLHTNILVALQKSLEVMNVMLATMTTDTGNYGNGRVSVVASVQCLYNVI